MGRSGHVPRQARLRRHQWSSIERAGVIAALAIVMGSLFLTIYTLSLGDPVPRRIDAALVGNPRTDAATVKAVQRVANNSLDFTESKSAAAAIHAIDLQRVYAALDLTSARPTLYVSSASGASVARVLEKTSSVDPRVRIVDTHPLKSTDPSGLDIFYLMLVATIIGFLTVFQTRALAGGLPLRRWTGFVVAFALVAGLALTLVESPILNRLDIPLLEVWGILAVHIVAVASFAAVSSVLIGPWAIIPTWLFFVVLGNSSSGGPVSPPLLPGPFAFISQWLPSGATVTSLRDAAYFPSYQHAPAAARRGGLGRRALQRDAGRLAPSPHQPGRLLTPGEAENAHGVHHTVSTVSRSMSGPCDSSAISWRSAVRVSATGLFDRPERSI